MALPFSDHPNYSTPINTGGYAYCTTCGGYHAFGSCPGAPIGVLSGGYWCNRCFCVHPYGFLCFVPNVPVATRKVKITDAKILIDDGQIEIAFDSITQTAEVETQGDKVSVRIKARDASGV